MSSTMLLAGIRANENNSLTFPACASGFSNEFVYKILSLTVAGAAQVFYIPVSRLTASHRQKERRAPKTFCILQ